MATLFELANARESDIVVQISKTLKHTANREASVTIRRPPETSRTSRHYGTEGLKEGPDYTGKRKLLGRPMLKTPLGA